MWRASQLLILLNTALDPILYGVYGEAMRSTLEVYSRKQDGPCFIVGTLSATDKKECK